MKLKFLFTVAIVGLVALSAQAKKKPHLPGSLEKIGKSSMVSISELRTYDHSIVTRLIARSNFNDVYDADDSRVVGTIERDGDVDMAPYFPKTKTLSPDMLRFIATSGACDLDTTGACLVYTKKDGDGHAIVIGTRTFSSGKTFILQAAYQREGFGSADVDSMAERLKRKSDSKYVVFTNLSAADVSDESDDRDDRNNRRRAGDRERRLKYEANSRYSSRSTR